MPRRPARSPSSPTRPASDSPTPAVSRSSSSTTLAPPSGEIAAWVYRTGGPAAEEFNPPLLFGTTGTNGKTSTSYLLEAILRQLGLVTGLSSTAERHIGDLTVVSRLTTPEASEMHALLARMRESAVRAVAIEVSAQALTWNRVDGIVFDVVAFTNLSHDHLDDYADMEEYFRAKLPLFQPDRAKRGVVCLDTAYGRRVVEESRIPVTTIATVGHASPEDVEFAEWVVEVTDESAVFTEFRLTGPEGRSLVTREPLIGWHMAANAALAIVMLVEAGFELEAIGAALSVPDEDGDAASRPTCPAAPSGSPATAGPASTSTSATAPTRSRTPWGRCASSPPAARSWCSAPTATGMPPSATRWRASRRRAATSWSSPTTTRGSRIPLRSARPCSREPHSPRTSREIYEVSPPEAAIIKAVSLAREGDSILWAGPGHQDYRDIEGVRTPYSARELARAALREAGWA